tara:strand:- start:448 stop:588 length:141 start_codon:yes stop_codon:yes gene_type:complete
MKILLLIAVVFAISGILLLYLNYRIKKKNNAEIYNNIKKLDDADKL